MTLNTALQTLASGERKLPFFVWQKSVSKGPFLIHTILETCLSITTVSKGYHRMDKMPKMTEKTHR